MSDYFIFAGEASGDLHGSRLIEALQAADSSSEFYGVGGPRMRKVAFESLLPMEEFQVMGFSDVALSLPRLLKLFYQVEHLILKKNPPCTILIDYPGFNLRLARSLRKNGYRGKLVQYVCPTVWAHGKKRIEILDAYYDLLLSIFPFEAEYFSQKQVKVEYIGNPLTETIRTHCYDPNWHTPLGMRGAEHLIALFPGSRKGEIQTHVPLQLQAAALLKERDPDLTFGLSCAHEELKEPLLSMAKQSPLVLNKDLFIIPSHNQYDLMRECTSALAKSGTVTLELALHGVPTVVHYDLSLLNYLFAKYFLRLQLPHYCIVNILRKEAIYPELIGRGFGAADLKRELENIHFNPMERARIAESCENLKKLLGTGSAHKHAAEAIRRIL